MIVRGLRRQNALSNMVRGGGAHWHRPDTPLNVRWTPERHYSIFDMNTWFYDGCMPEYMFHNHEQLSGAGSTVKEALKVQSDYFLRGVVLIGLFSSYLYFLNGGYDLPFRYEEDNIDRRMAEEMKKEKIAYKKDFMGSNYSGENGELSTNYNGRDPMASKQETGAQTVKTALKEANQWWDGESKRALDEAIKRATSGKLHGAHHH